MTVSLVDGIAAVALDGAFIQEVSLEDTVENDKTMGMVDGAAEYVHVYPFCSMTKGNVKGRGDLTLAPGVGGDVGITYEGGLVFVPSVKYNEKINQSSDWEYSFEYLPNAA